MKKALSSLRRALSGFTANEYAVFLVVASGFIHIFIQAALIALLPVYALATRQAKLCLPKKKYGYLFLLFAVIALLTTFVHAADAYWEGFHFPTVDSAGTPVRTVVVSSLYLKGLAVLIVGLFFDLHFFSNVMTRKASLAAMKLAAGMSGAAFFVSLIQRLTESWVSPERAGRVASVFSNENYYGTVVEFMLIITAYLFFRAKTAKGKILCGAIFAMNAAGLFFSGCRTAFVCSAAALLIFFLIYDKRIFFALLGAGIFAGTIWIVTHFYFLTPYAPLFVSDDASHDIQYRLGIWKTAWDAFCDHFLFGRGFYSYSSAWMNYNGGNYFAIHAHNLYLDTLANFGIAGFLSLFGYFGFALTDLFSGLIRRRQKAETALCLGVLAAVLLHGLTDVTLIWTQTAAIPALILLCPNAYLPEDETKETA